MQIVADIPEEIAEIFRRDPDIGRGKLVERHGLTNHEARIYAWAFRYGKFIYGNEIKTEPEDERSKLALVLPDIHAPYHDSRALGAAIEYGEKRKPDVVIIHGDGVDCYAISSWKTDPLRPIFKVEVEQAKRILKFVAKAFPDAEKIYLEGNHEMRLRHLLWGGSKMLAGLEALTIPSIYGLGEMGWKYVSNSQLLENDIKPFSLGKLFVLHGHEMRVTYSAVNIPRIYYLRNHVNMLIAHHHQTQEYIARRLDLHHEGAFSVGCLCKLSPDYSPANNWNHGFALVSWDSDGDFSVENKKIIGGKVL